MTDSTLTADGARRKANPREEYARELARLGSEHSDVVVLTADLAGSNKLDGFRSAHPERFFNVGIAEQNLIGISAGLALDGKTPFASTFAAFASMRAHEQVRTDVAYPNLSVKMIATMSGVSGGTVGPTHQAIEDIGTMRMMPNMTVIAPGDPLQMDQFIRQAYELPGPVYIRLGRGEDPVIYPYGQPVEIGRAITVQEGRDATIIACGTILGEALSAAGRLRDEGISCRVIDMHTIKPLDRPVVIQAAEETGVIVTAEDHSIIGGLGSAVCEVIAENGIGRRVLRLGLPDVFGLVGPPAELAAHHGFASEGIRLAVKRGLQVAA